MGHTVCRKKKEKETRIFFCSLIIPIEIADDATTPQKEEEKKKHQLWTVGILLRSVA